MEQRGFNIGIYFLKLSVILTIAIMIRIIEISLPCHVTLISNVKLKSKFLNFCYFTKNQHSVL